MGACSWCTVSNCYFANIVTRDYFSGGMVGSEEHSNVTNLFWDVELSGLTNGCGFFGSSSGMMGKTTSEMKDIVTYTDLSTIGLYSPWDFLGNPFDDTGNEDYWDIDTGTNNGYPYLTQQLTSIDDKILDNEENINQITDKVTMNNYPNPFNPQTTISFTIQKTEKINLTIYNIKGQKVKTLVNEEKEAGNHSIIWNGKDEAGKTVSSGVYLSRIQVGNFSKTNKMMMMK